MKKRITGPLAAMVIFSFVLSVGLFFGVQRTLAADQINLLVNPGLEEEGVPVYQGGWGDPTYNWHPFSQGYARGQISRAGGYGIDISSGDTVSLAGAYQRVSLDQTEIKPVFVGGFIKGENIVNSPNGYFGGGIYVEIHLDDGRIVYWNSLANYGTFDWHWIGFNTSSLTVDGVNKLVNRPISHIFIVPILAYASGTVHFDDLAVYEMAPSAPAITLMFDDGENDTYSIAKPILDQHGLKGSAAIISDMPGTSTSFMSWAEIKELSDGGWNMASHSRTHRDLTALSQADLQTEINNQSVFTAQGLTVNSFVTPFGAYNNQVMIEAEKAGYTSARNYEQGDNPQGTFPYEVKIRGVLYTTTLNEVASWINEAKTNKSWIVITFHSISPIGDDAYHVTPDMFTSIVQAVAASGVNVITYDQGVATYGVTK